LRTERPATAPISDPAKPNPQAALHNWRTSPVRSDHRIAVPGVRAATTRPSTIRNTARQSPADDREIEPPSGRISPSPDHPALTVLRWISMSRWWRRIFRVVARVLRSFEVGYFPARSAVAAWSAEEKLRVLAQSVAPGSSVLLVCRMHGRRAAAGTRPVPVRSPDPLVNRPCRWQPVSTGMGTTAALLAAIPCRLSDYW
jgi:hypothetical protein